MAGVGKSTIGVLLAKALHRNFVDTDIVVQSAEGRCLQEIMDEGGKEAFQAVEERHVLSIHILGAVIATGGSVVYSNMAMAHLSRNAVTVYLKLPLDQLEKRVENVDTRGLAMEAGQSFEDVYHERLPLYERYADVTIDCEGLNHDEVVVRVVASLAGKLRSTG